jgi:hypothetical protein
MDTLVSSTSSRSIACVALKLEVETWFEQGPDNPGLDLGSRIFWTGLEGPCATHLESWASTCL